MVNWIWQQGWSAVLTLRGQPPATLRAGRVALLVSIIWVLNLFDLALTVMAHQQGLLVECNPLAVIILPYGTEAICLFKIGMVAFGTCVLLYQRNSALAETLAWMVVCVYAAVAVQWTLCYDFYEMLVASAFQEPRLRAPSAMG